MLPGGRKTEHLFGEVVLRVNRDQLKAVLACPRGGEKTDFPYFQNEIGKVPFSFQQVNKVIV